MPSRKESSELDELLKLTLASATASTGKGRHILSTTRTALVADLRAFDEDSVADAIPKLSDSELSRLFERAGVIDQRENSSSRSLCLAAVEIVEGKKRPLARKRKKSAS